MAADAAQTSDATQTADSAPRTNATQTADSAPRASQQLTRAAYERLRDELAELSGPRKVAVTEQVATARALGDLSENGDYHAAREELGKLNGRIMQLEHLLEEANVIDAAASTDQAHYGSVVSLRFNEEDKTEEFLLGSIEERPEKCEVISPTSPLGQAVLDAKVGDEVSYEAPAGPQKVELVSVSPLGEAQASGGQQRREAKPSMTPSHSEARPRTLSEKVWDAHVVHSGEGEADLLYIDLHLIHEVTSPQAFDGLRMAGRKVRRADLTLATEDHNVPTTKISGPVVDPISRRQLEALRANCAEFGVPLYPMGHDNQGIVHVIGPELGLTLPGMTVVCGDSHTSTHGAFGALAFGIGTSELEHVLATQTLPQVRPDTMAVTVTDELPLASTAKDLILAVIGRIGTGGGIGSVIEYRGTAIERLSMEGRMTVCNMSIEAGARAGMIAPDATTFAYLEGRTHAPANEEWEQAMDFWLSLASDEGAAFDREVLLNGDEIPPHVTWGTNPSHVAPLTGQVPSPDEFAAGGERDAAARALTYMGLAPGTPIREIAVDTVFIGSCTNSRIEDLRAVAEVAAGRRVASGVRTLVVPGSAQVKAQAEAEGLHEVLTAAGFDWREPGCSMCLGMNPDKLSLGERSASTSNRNFEGRQGRGGRTHLVSPAVAAATAVAGHFAAPSDLN